MGKRLKRLHSTGRALRTVTAHGTDAVAWPPASGRGTRCGGTGGVSSSRRRGRRLAQPQGGTLTGWAARRRGGKKKVSAAALLDGEGALGTLMVSRVAQQLREGN
jgi:ribosomal protein L28